MLIPRMSDDGELLLFAEEKEKAKKEKKKEAESSDKPVSSEKTSSEFKNEASLRKELARLTAKIESFKKYENPGSSNEKSNAGAPKVTAPNLDLVLSSPDNFLKYIQTVVGAYATSLQEILLSKVEEIDEKFRPVLNAYTTHAEFQQALKKYPDLFEYQEEMASVAASLKEDEDMTVEELYWAAKERKAETMEEQENKEDPVSQSAEEKSKDTDVAVPEENDEQDSILKLLGKPPIEDSSSPQGDRPKGGSKSIDDSILAAMSELSAV